MLVRRLSILATISTLLFTPQAISEQRGMHMGGKHMRGHMDNRLSEGGRLYDKWWQEYGLKKPAQTHPAYPSKGVNKGASTWRCKECHGWDYRGKEGTYNKGSHFTGIKGIREYVNTSPNEIMRILKDDNHQYNTVMRDRALNLLARFVANGQVDTTQFIDDKTAKAKGDIRIGQHVFADKCVRCHGTDGTDINFKDSKNPEYIGTVASKNPWEALHKIYNGHPGSSMHHMTMHNSNIRERYKIGLIRSNEPMPSMRFKLSSEGIKHLLTYMQTLPAK
ncbi:MAG: cytochrome c [Gammaproteobacteria bacterium]|nr:cytochrome c [Gammaproteobacteria bacterium]